MPSALYKQVVGLVLWYAAYRLFRGRAAAAARQIPAPVGLLCGAGIGLLSGLTGIGGGIFLGPILLIAGWAEIQQAAGVSAAFILVNSVAGILGLLTKVVTLPTAIPYWAAAAVAGGLVGSELGSKRLGHPALRHLLAVVLLIAGVMLMLIN